MRSATLGQIPGLPQEFGNDFARELFRRGNFARHFELKVKEAYDKKIFSIPIYLSLGSEFNSAALSLSFPDCLIFGQHRCHSLYLNYGGKPEELRDELLGLPSGCSGGMSGSNAIQGRDIKMFGHSGLMGEQIPIAVGAALASSKRTLAICGDASVEEDYIYPSLGFTATRKLPVLFVCEDNDLSILTKTEVRRNWSPVDVARSLGIPAVDITDDPWLIAHHTKQMSKNLPGFINIRTVRVLWHAGVGTDGLPEWDRYEWIRGQLADLGLGNEMEAMDRENKGKTDLLWEKQLQKR
ncbi:thiamine pyrophosphate-dependent enzyme [bacterium]|nr:thiamine pyrophosphate-dependent enzyme [bacterium]